MSPTPVRRALLLAACTVPIAGCGSLLSSEAPRFEFHVIEDLRAAQAGAGPAAAAAPNAAATPAAATPAAAPPAAAPRVPRTLLVSLGSAQALYDSDRIVFSADGTARAYYQYSNWSERPARRIAVLAEGRLARDGGFGTVAQSLAGVRGDLMLGLRLDELTHDDSVSPGMLRLAVIAELVDWRTRALVARRSFVQSVPVSSRDARGASRAASAAVTALLDELSPWVERSAAAIGPGAAASR